MVVEQREQLNLIPGANQYGYEILCALWHASEASSSSISDVQSACRSRTWSLLDVPLFVTQQKQAARVEKAETAVHATSTALMREGANALQLSVVAAMAPKRDAVVQCFAKVAHRSKMEKVFRAHVYSPLNSNSQHSTALEIDAAVIG
eukprot:6175716-Pleurochrysis_carterae.AAC.2